MVLVGLGISAVALAVASIVISVRRLTSVISYLRYGTEALGSRSWVRQTGGWGPKSVSVRRQVARR